MSAKASLPSPCLMLVTDRQRCQGRSLPDAVALAVAGGVNAVQVREKDLSGMGLLALGRQLRGVTGGKALLIINNRPELLADCQADGVHLPEQGPDLRSVRRLVGGDMLVGRSVHSVAAAVAAERDGADYVVLGTIYPSPSHPEGPVAGPQLIAQVKTAVSLPIIAIGGITAANAATAMQAGAAGVAVISAILGAADPRQASAELREAITVAKVK